MPGRRNDKKPSHPRGPYSYENSGSGLLPKSRQYELDFVARPIISVPSATRFEWDFTLAGETGPEGSGVLEIQYKIDDGSMSSWAQAPVSITVEAEPRAAKTLEVRGRDAYFPQKSTSPWLSFTIPPSTKGLDDDTGQVDPEEPFGNSASGRWGEYLQDRYHGRKQADEGMSAAIRELIGEAIEQARFIPIIGGGRGALDITDEAGIQKLLDHRNRKVTPNLTGPGGDPMDTIEGNAQDGKTADNDLGALDTAGFIDRVSAEVLDLLYPSGSKASNLEPAEAGAEQNPASMAVGNLNIIDDGSDDEYNAFWDYTQKVDSTFDVTMKCYREGSHVGSTTVTATNGSATFTDTGAGDGVSNDHKIVLELKNSSGDILQTFVNDNLISAV